MTSSRSPAIFLARYESTCQFNSTFNIKPDVQIVYIDVNKFLRDSFTGGKSQKTSSNIPWSDVYKYSWVDKGQMTHSKIRYSETYSNSTLTYNFCVINSDVAIQGDPILSSNKHDC